MKRFCIGDIHGNYKGLKQALERSAFDYDNDLLITLGDICDGYSHVYDCVEELLKIKNRIDVVGNHDEPFTVYINTGFHDWGWSQGGEATLKSYGERCLGDAFKMEVRPKMSGNKVITNLNPGDIPETHKEFFKHQISYYIAADNNCFVHGGFNRHELVKEQNTIHFCWDRDLWSSALAYKSMTRDKSKKYPFKIKDNFKEVFIGHTSTINWGTTLPMNAANIWNLDTGAGFDGKVTIMNVDTHEYWQSDLAEELYQYEKGRR